MFGDQVEDSETILVGSVKRGLALLDRLLRASGRCRRRDVRPGMALQYVKDIWTSDAQREAGLFVLVVKLIEVRATEWAYTPQ